MRMAECGMPNGKAKGKEQRGEVRGRRSEVRLDVVLCRQTSDL